MPSLRISVEGQIFEATVPQRAVRVGSDESADVRIEIKSVAAEHCVIEPLPNGALKVKDANSGRSTRVNGNTIRQVSVNIGDEIQVGDARLRYIADNDRVVAEKPKAPPTPPPAAAPAAAATPAAAASPAAAAPQAPAPTTLTERRKGEDRRRPENAHIKPKVERRQSVRRSSDRARSESAGARARRAKKSSTTPWVIGVAAVVVVALVVALTGTSSDVDTGADQGQLSAALRLVESKDYDEAKTAFEGLRRSKAPAIARQAREQLRVLAGIERSMKAELDERWLAHLDLTPGMLERLKIDLRERHGDFGEARAKAFSARVREAQKAWLTQRLEAMHADATQARGRQDFVSMLAAWNRLERSAPAGVDVAQAVEDGRAAVHAAADEDAAKLVGTARDWLAKRHAARALTILDNALPGYEGFKAKDKLTKAIADIRAAAATMPEPTTVPTDTEQPTQPTPTDKPEPTKPTDEAILAAANKEIREHVEARDFAKAVTTAMRANLPGRVKDLTNATAAFDSLRAHINAKPKSYRNLTYSKGLRLDVTSADETGFTGAIRGGSSNYRWGRVKTSFFARLVKRWKPKGADALNAATLLHVVGDAEAADAWLVTAGESGADTLAMFDALARWRNEPVPEGGYVLYEGRYVTPDERDRLIREARIVQALAWLESDKPDDRKKAYDALFEIGEPAAERFRKAMDSRRARLIDEIAASKSFTSGKYKRKLFTALKAARTHALALIRDAAAYPYPNPQKQNQKEVEARVDKVRQIWERPFELVVEWDKTLNERLTEVTELDEVISRLDDEYEPDLDVLKEKISAAINMPAYTPDGKSSGIRSYSLKVLSFNERVPTTATKEERNNVRAVNDYRMMMGMNAVKINEKLTRAARGHSRHMKQNGYFAHNVPADKGANNTNRTPGNRAKLQGYGGGVGENIAMGTWTGYDAFLAWFGSSGHHRNMLGRWTEMGAGRSNGSWWTQLFGAASGKSTKTPDKLPDPEPAFAPEPEDDTGRPVGPPGGQVPDEVPPSEGELDEDEGDAEGADGN